MATSSSSDYYIIRTDRAGVFFARIKSRRPKHNSIVLADARKIWRWSGANSVEDIAVAGIDPASHVTRVVPEIEVYAPCQVIRCTEAAAACIAAIREWHA